MTDRPRLVLDGATMAVSVVLCLVAWAALDRWGWWASLAVVGAALLGALILALSLLAAVADRRGSERC